MDSTERGSSLPFNRVPSSIQSLRQSVLGPKGRDRQEKKVEEICIKIGGVGVLVFVGREERRKEGLNAAGAS